MFAEGFILSLANTLGIPIGAKLRKASPSRDTTNYIKELPDLIKAIVSITRDDVCMGENPLFYKSSRKRLGKNLIEVCDAITSTFNKQVSNIAWDILVKGYSTFLYRIEDGKLQLIPYLDDCIFYLDFQGNVITADADGKEIHNALTFITYEKSDLTKPDNFDKVPLLIINPQGLQLRNSSEAIQDLVKAENAIKRLRAQTRYIRFATVDVGINQGDQQQSVVDDIAEGLNANSQDLQNTDSFDDQIPVFPTRKSIGRPELHESIPSVDVGKLTDLDYYLSKVFLTTRFPKTYLDFSTNLTPAAVTLIRGDLRYAKIVQKCQAVITARINELFESQPALKKAGIVWDIIKTPTSEDADVVATLQGTNQFIQDIFNQIESSSSDRATAVAVANVMFETYRTSTSLKFVEVMYNRVMDYINEKYAEGSVDSDLPSEDLPSEDLPSV